MSRRRRFEGLLQTLMKQTCRSPIKEGGKAIPETYTTYRAGFKDCLRVLEVIDESTTELDDDQLQTLIDSLEKLTGDVPPPPNGS